MTPKFKFADGEKVLCFHGPLIYEAKLLKSQVTKDKQIKYFIHYAGWNKNWDEWVPENRVLKFNEHNCQKQKEVSKQHAAASKNNRKSTTKGKKGDGRDGDSRASTPSKESGSLTPTVPSRGRGSKSASKNSTDIPDEEAPKKKRGRPEASTANNSNNSTPTSNNTASLTNNSSTVEDEEEYQLKMEVKIPIPIELKQILVDDWDAINRQRKLLEIPAKITVEDILENYVTFKREQANINDIRTDVTDGLTEYFNVSLGSQLLYKFERPQYSEILQAHPNTPMCKLYGAHHFLRLFVNLGKMLAYTALDERYITTLQANFSDIFKYLIKNNSQYFDPKNFINSSPEYHRRTQ